MKAAAGRGLEFYEIMVRCRLKFPNEQYYVTHETMSKCWDWDSV